MPQGYSPEDIAKRIKQKSGSRMYEEIADLLEKKHTSIPVEIVKNTGTYRRMYQAVSYYRLPNPYAVRSGVRKDILNIDRLIDEVKYIRDNELEEVMTLIPEEIASDEDAVMVSDRIKNLRRELRMVKRIKENETSKENLKEKDKERNAKWKITN